MREQHLNGLFGVALALLALLLLVPAMQHLNGLFGVALALLALLLLVPAMQHLNGAVPAATFTPCRQS